MIYVWLLPYPHLILLFLVLIKVQLNSLLFFTHIQLIYVSRSSYVLFLLLRILSSIPPIVLLTIQTSPQMSLSQRTFHSHSLELSLLFITHTVFNPFCIYHMKLSSFFVCLSKQNANYVGRKTLFNPQHYIFSISFIHCFIALLSRAQKTIIIKEK